MEIRVERLESLLRENDISYPPPENLEYCSRADLAAPVSPSEGETPRGQAGDDYFGDDPHRAQRLGPRPAARGAGVVPPSSRHLGSATGVSFARVVFAAVQSSVSDQKSLPDKHRVRPSRQPAAPNGGPGAMGTSTSMRDSFFGLHTKPTISPATFPSRELALKLVTLYFEHANPQLPVLHRVDFMRLFDKAFAEKGRALGPRELYMLNMVFAIGGGIVMGDQPRRDSRQGDGDRSKQCHPEEYHASAIVHLEACLSNSGGGLDELQAVLLLANFALLRPVPPGLW